uniref:Uncharacterized protein n=1 Tax=Arundo donax TaxID=35708 RepID=A0A0A9HL98_ARUDO
MGVDMLLVHISGSISVTPSSCVIIVPLINNLVLDVALVN